MSNEARMKLSSEEDVAAEIGADLAGTQGALPALDHAATVASAQA